MARPNNSVMVAGSKARNGSEYPQMTPERPVMRTVGEPTISTERVTMSVRMRFNPLRGLTPERLAQYLDQFDLGFFRLAAITWDKIERRDATLKAVAPKRKKAVARHGYDILSLDKIEDSQKTMAAEQVKALKYFYDNLTATNAIRPDEEGGISLLARQMMDAQSKYYSVHEIVWQPGTEGLTAQFVHCPLWWFEGVTGKLRYMDSEFQVYGRDMTASEWLVTCGEGLMEACSVAWMFLHLTMQDWLAYCEKFGTPFIDAATTASPGTSEWDSLVEYVQNFGPDGGGVRSQSATIALVEPKANSAETFDLMAQNMKRAMITLWRGGDLGTTSNPDGTGASLQGDESDILEGDDAVLIEETLELKVSRFVIAWQFGPDAPLLARLKFKQEQDPDAVQFQREIFKAFAADGTVVDILANQTDLKKLTQDVGLPVNEEYVDPYVPVRDNTGQPITGELALDPEGDVIGAKAEAPSGAATAPNGAPGGQKDGKGKSSEVINEAADLSDLEEAGHEAYAAALATDLEHVRTLVAGLTQIGDDRILTQRALEVRDEIEKLKADILHMPRAARALAETMLAALFTGLTEKQPSTRK